MKCQSCGLLASRKLVQSQIEAMNEDAAKNIRNIIGEDSLRADGDAEIENVVNLATFTIPDCPKCGGILKPDVVFFGDNVSEGFAPQPPSSQQQSNYPTKLYSIHLSGTTRPCQGMLFPHRNG